MYIGLQVKCLPLLSYFNDVCFRDRLSKNIPISNFIKIEMFHANGQGDMTKRTAVFRNFANAPKKGLNCCLEVSITAPLVCVRALVRACAGVRACVCACVRVDCFMWCLSQALPQITVT